MRTLSIKQKELIMKYVKSNYMTEVIKDELLTKLEKINDYETLWSDMKRFINDYEYSLDGNRYILNWRDWS